MWQRDGPFATFDVKINLPSVRGFESLPFLPRPQMVGWSHARKSCLAQRLVENDGGAVGKVEGADTVVVGIDEVAADVLLQDGLVAVLGVPERLLMGLPGISVIE